jgi:hypothetical protein
MAEPRNLYTDQPFLRVIVGQSEYGALQTSMRDSINPFAHLFGHVLRSFDLVLGLGLP